MNARNLKYIRTANTKKAVKLANDKIASKQALIKAGLPVADLYGIIKNRDDLLTFNWSNLPNSFVLKPSHGLGGEGIMVVFGKKKEEAWVAGGEQEVNVKNLIEHTSNILDGNFSLSNIPDIAFFEQRLKSHGDFKKINWKGIPDIRILIFNNVPVMAMLRLPTKESGGKANLHQGGIGVGIDVVSGKTTFATQKDKLIERHPDTKTILAGFEIPDWNKILKISIKAAQAISLGYSGVDIVIDRDKGPVILEINGHPGLSIQNANLTTLKDRLDRVAGLDVETSTKGIKVSKQLFGKTPKEGNKEEKIILGFIESVDIVLADNKKQTVRAKIDTGIVSTTINKQLAVKLGLQNIIDNFNSLVGSDTEKVKASKIKEVEKKYNALNNPGQTGIQQITGVKKGDDYVLRPKILISFILKNQTIKTEVALAKNDEISYPLVIGRKDLQNFLIDPTKSLTNN